MRWVESITDSMDMNLSKLRKIVKDRGTWHAAVQGVTKSRTQLSGRTTSLERVAVCTVVSPHLTSLEWKGERCRGTAGIISSAGRQSSDSRVLLHSVAWGLISR